MHKILRNAHSFTCDFFAVLILGWLVAVALFGLISDVSSAVLSGLLMAAISVAMTWGVTTLVLPIVRPHTAGSGLVPCIDSADTGLPLHCCTTQPQITAGSGLVPCIAKPVVWYAQKYTQRDDAIRAAYSSGGFSMREVGEHFGLHYSVVSRVISRARNKT